MSDLTSAYEANLSFGLFSSSTLRLRLISVPTSNENNTNPLSKLFQELDDKRFSFLDAHRIIGISHVATAANLALMRRSQREQKIESGSDDNKKGIAFETVLCLAGSTHVGNILRDYAFQSSSNDKNNKNKNKNKNNIENTTILVLGYDCTKSEMDEFISNKILSSVDSSTELNQCQKFLSYLDRTRTEEEKKDIMKLFKLTKEEIDMSSLEQAVVNKVGTKYIT